MTASADAQLFDPGAHITGTRTDDDGAVLDLDIVTHSPTFLLERQDLDQANLCFRKLELCEVGRAQDKTDAQDLLAQEPGPSYTTLIVGGVAVGAVSFLAGALVWAQTHR